MTAAVRFERVSKQYQLGLTRTSIPSLISQAMKNLFDPSSPRTNKDRAFWALRDVSFELDRGQSLALVGANGAGKTTVLKLLARITRPTAGRIQTDGHLSALIELGAGFHPDLTGRENIYLNGTILGLKRREIDRRFDEIVAFSELEEFIDTPVKRYSSGMAVRLGFAVASCIEPDILLVDEVLAVGDAAFRLKCMQRIQSLLDGGTSIVFVSHNLYLVRAVCTEALYLSRGQVRERGKTADVIEAYERDIHEQRALRLHGKQPGGVAGGGGVNIEITKVDVIGTSGEVGRDIHSSHSATIRIHYVAYQPVAGVNIAVHITRTDATTCCMMRTSLDGVCLAAQAGEGVVHAVLRPIQLIGGVYFAEAHLLNSGDSVVIGSAASGWFLVSGSGLSYEERSGVFQPNVSWEHYQHNGSIPLRPSGTELSPRADQGNRSPVRLP